MDKLKSPVLRMLTLILIADRSVLMIVYVFAWVTIGWFIDVESYPKATRKKTPAARSH